MTHWRGTLCATVIALGTTVIALPTAAALSAADLQLSAVQFPDRTSVSLKLIPTQRVSSAEGEASVKFKDGQASVELEYKRLPPAILFGGDVTCFVSWAVARDGHSENLGELIVRDSSGSAEYRTGLKEFALMVTAEPYPMVLAPSDLVIFTAAPPPPRKAPSTPFALAVLAPAAPHTNEQIGGMSFASDQPVELVQAQGVLAQAQAVGAETYNPDAMRDAKIALAQATNLFHSGRTREGVDYARRSLSLSSTAIRDTQRKLADKAAADAEARRAAELQALEQQRLAAQQQAAAAQAQALDAREQALYAREQLARSQEQLATAQQQAASLQQQALQAQQDAAAAQERAAAAGLSAEAAESARREADDARGRAEALAEQARSAQADAESASAALQTQKSQLESRVTQTEAENARLRKERDDLAGQLNTALSSVAEITQTARGVVVSLPDILFDTNKATLKPNAQIAMGKLAGIVSVFPNINLRIEGHTDSTGTDAINDPLSRERANSVMSFLKSQGVAASRMSAEGYGSRIPVADNATPEGRSKNRRVEIVLAEGVIRGAGR